MIVEDTVVGAYGATADAGTADNAGTTLLGDDVNTAAADATVATDGVVAIMGAEAAAYEAAADDTAADSVTLLVAAAAAAVVILGG